MALNYRGDGRRIELNAGGNRTGGAPTVEGAAAGKFAGIPNNTVSSGANYTMHLLGEFELTDPATAAVGDVVYIKDADNTLSLNAGAAGKRVFGRVSRISSQKGVPTGKMWVVLAGPGMISA